MAQHGQSKTGLCLVLVLMCALFPRSSRAAEGDTPIRLYAFAESGPIGKVYSLGTFAIDGCLAHGEVAIWGGEEIQTAAGSCVSIDIELVGRITLKNAAIARLAATIARRDGGAHRMVVASLFEGDMAVTLQPGAAAYIESCGSVFTSSIGSRFDILTRNGRAFLETATGSVEVQTSRRPPIIKARTVRVNPSGPPVPIATTPLERKTNQKAQASSQWLKYYENTSGQTFSLTPRAVLAGYQATPQTTPQTTPAQEPAANRIVRFRLDPLTLGTLIPDQKPTDGQGVVSVEFQASNNEGRGFIVADMVPDSTDLPGTTYETYRRPVRVTRLFWTKTKLFIAAGALAAVVTCAVACGPKNKPLQQAPPPNLP